MVVAAPTPDPPLTMTITLEPDEGTRLIVLSREADTSPEEYTTRIVRRALIKAEKSGRAAVGGSHNEARATERALRQLALAEHVKAHGVPTGTRERKAVADQLDTSVTTMLRDLEAVTVALSDPTTVGKGGP